MIGTEYGNSHSEKMYSKIVWEGEVVDVLDGDENGVIRIRIPELDKTVADAELPLCYPLFNFSFFRALPKVGERVTLMFRNIYNTTLSNSKDIRYWISVVHSNIYDIDHQNFLFESNNHYTDGIFRPPPKIANIASTKGIYAGKEDISINGRNNSSIFLRNNSLLFKVGAHEKNKPLIFNKTNPAYITLKYPNEIKKSAAKKNVKTKTYITPKTQIIVQYISDLKGLLQVKDKEKNKVVSTQLYNKNSKSELTVALKSGVLGAQKNFPFWELSYSDAALNGLPKLYSTNLTDTFIEKDILIDKSINFSSSLIASDKIFLISHLNNKFNVKSQPDLITDEELFKLSENGHPVPYGDKLIELLDLMKQVISNHTHPYAAMSTVPDNLLLKLLNFDMQSILNKNVLTG